LEDIGFKKKIASLAKEDRKKAREPLIKAYTSLFLTFDIIENYVSGEMSHLDLSRAGRNILHILIMNGGSMTATEISRQAWRSKFSTIRVIDTLEKGGYVLRSQPNYEIDRRKKVVTITEKGLTLCEKIMNISTEKLCYDVLHGLTEEQIEALFEVLKHIRKHTFELINDSSNPYLYRAP
jgi:DNA-binding MarR family transcriptional regulator